MDVNELRKTGLVMQSVGGWSVEGRLVTDAADRIEELEAELAKLRRVIGEIPEGEQCCTNQKACKHARFYGCGLFMRQRQALWKCAACIAAFPEGNNQQPVEGGTEKE